VNLNPLAENLDPRWPEPSVDMGYLKPHRGEWVLFDFFGRAIYADSNKSQVFFKAVEYNVNLAPLQ